MFGYENTNGLLQFLEVKNCSQKHQCDNTDWSMVEIMHDIIKASITKVMNTTNYISCDVVISVYNYSWLSLRGYVITD